MQQALDSKSEQVSADGVQLTPNSSGFFNKKTARSYGVSLSIGSEANLKSATTAGGYKVMMNIQEKVTQ